MNKKTIKSLSLGLGVLGVAFLISPITGSADDASDAIADALSAAWPGMAENATVVDWEGNVLREGSNGYTCFPTWSNKKDFAADRLGISYMLAGDEGASNIDPFAEGPTDDNEWVVEGPHLMIIVPPELLEGFPTDPDNGGPYVMWKGTPYAHLMVPVGARN
jgi:hypothetical protein